MQTASRVCVTLPAQLQPVGCRAAAARAPARRRAVLVRASDEERDLDRRLLEDLERVRLRQQREQEAAFERGFFQPKSIRPPPSNSPAAEPSALRQAIDKALIADFFFVLFAAVWLVVGLGVKVATDSTAVLDAWLPLWQWVFQPAIGVLMLGTIVQGTMAWARDNWGKEE